MEMHQVHARLFYRRKYAPITHLIRGRVVFRAGLDVSENSKIPFLATNLTQFISGLASNLADVVTG